MSRSCYDRQLVNTLKVQDGWTEDGKRIMCDIPNVMSENCVYSKHVDDKECEGCKWKDQK